MNNVKTKGLVQLYHDNGTKQGEGIYINGKCRGTWTWWDETGKVIKTETYKNGRVVNE